MSRRSHGALLHRAAQILGGDDKLREFLQAPQERFVEWQQGSVPLPWDQFLKTVDLLSDYYDDQIRRSRSMLDAYHASKRNREQAYARRGVRLVLREKALPERLPQGRQPSVRHALFDPAYAPRSMAELMEASLDAALAVTHTDLGDVQLLDVTGRSHVEAQRGFSPRLADALSTIEIGLAQQDRPVYVSDLQNEPIFLATREGEAIISAGSRALACTPIVHSSGLRVGSISAHYREAHRKDPASLALLQLVGRRTAVWLDARPA